MDVVRSNLWRTEGSGGLRNARRGEISGEMAQPTKTSALIRAGPSEVCGNCAPSPHRRPPQPAGATGALGGFKGNDPSSRRLTCTGCTIDGSRSRWKREVTRCEQPARASAVHMSQETTVHATRTVACIRCLEGELCNIPGTAASHSPNGRHRPAIKGRGLYHLQATIKAKQSEQIEEPIMNGKVAASVHRRAIQRAKFVCGSPGKPRSRCSESFRRHR
jgi:hypothetical protein